MELAGFNAWNYDFAVARYNTNGSLDDSFDVDGKVTTDFASGQIMGLRRGDRRRWKVIVVETPD